MFSFLFVDQSVIQNLCCADDHIVPLHHFPEEIFLLTHSADLYEVIKAAQVRLELFAVMLVN